MKEGSIWDTDSLGSGYVKEAWYAEGYSYYGARLRAQRVIGRLGYVLLFCRTCFWGSWDNTHEPRSLFHIHICCC